MSDNKFAISKLIVATLKTVRSDNHEAEGGNYNLTRQVNIREGLRAVSFETGKRGDEVTNTYYCDQGGGFGRKVNIK